MTNYDYIVQSFAILALVSSQIYKLPQIYKLYKTKSGGDISKRSILVQTFSYVAWTMYSILKFDIYYFISNLLSLIQNILIQFMKWYYNKKEKIKENNIELTNIIIES